VVLRGSVLSRVLAPVLSAALEPDVVSTVPPLLQALEALPRLELVSLVPMRLYFRPQSCLARRQQFLRR